MIDEKTFYHSSDWGGLKPGSSISFQRSLMFDADKAAVHIKPLVSLDKAELEKRKKDSETGEKSIHAEIMEKVKEWEKKASQTLLLTRTLEYLNTEEVKHTSNQWEQDKEGTWEISNRVYKMWFKITDVPGKAEISLKWSLAYNLPSQPNSRFYRYNRYDNPWGADIYIVKPEKRGYASVASAQKFIQARFDEYCAYFSELSPPVPFDKQQMFSVNGYLLPGYTVAAPERSGPDMEAVDALLDLLDDEERTTPPPAPAIVENVSIPSKKPAQPTGKKPARPAPKPSRKKSKSAPAR